MSNESLTLDEWVSKAESATEDDKIMDVFQQPPQEQLPQSECMYALGSFVLFMVHCAIGKVLCTQWISQRNADERFPKKLITPGRRVVNKAEAHVLALLPNVGDQLEYLAAADIDTETRMLQTKFLNKYHVLLENKETNEPENLRETLRFCASARAHVNGVIRILDIPRLNEFPMFVNDRNTKIATEYSHKFLDRLQ